MALWLLLATSIVTTHAQFTCPEMVPMCVCKEDTAWWTIADDYRTLKIVNCSFNGLAAIPDLSSFRGKTFHRLLLNNNNISQITRKDFKDLSVNEIVLAKNPIRKISDDAFHDVRDDLAILDMETVRITIDHGLPYLRGLSMLKVLDLGYNQVTKKKYKTFPSGLFTNFNLSSLRTLTLQTLQMEYLNEGAFTGLEHLEQLDLSHNYLAEFPKELIKLKNLKDLKLYGNELQILENNTFTGMSNLRQLLIGVNEIDTIAIHAFDDLSNSIEEINLYHNPLSKVPTQAIRELTNLKKLSLVKTQLSEIENGSFIGEHKLKELHLDDNPELRFDDESMFYGIEDSLEVLFIRTLNLEALPLNVLRRLDKLFYLDATDNAIKKIDRQFFSGLKLTNIKLMWNKIKHIDHRAFRHFEKGVSLNVRKNRISDISFILDVEECMFDEVDFTDNIIPCDCNVEKVLNSGLVKWQVFGECYVERDEHEVTWYSFQEPALMDHLLQKCNRTKPYATCMQSTSGAPYLNIDSIMYISVIALYSKLFCL